MSETRKKRDFAAELRREMENSKVKDDEESKEECQYCHKTYKTSSLKQHEKRCKENPENQSAPESTDISAVVNLVLERVNAGQESLNKEMNELKEENQKLRGLVAELSKRNDVFSGEIRSIEENVKNNLERKVKSSTEIFTELMDYCKDSSNPLFKKLYQNSVTTQRKHWRVILIYTIDALIARGLI